MGKGSPLPPTPTHPISLVPSPSLSVLVCLGYMCFIILSLDSASSLSLSLSSLLSHSGYSLPGSLRIILNDSHYTVLPCSLRPFLQQLACFTLPHLNCWAHHSNFFGFKKFYKSSSLITGNSKHCSSLSLAQWPVN